MGGLGPRSPRKCDDGSLTAIAARQVIDFFKPLTIIVGHNGAGKTVSASRGRHLPPATLLPGGSRDADVSQLAVL